MGDVKGMVRRTYHMPGAIRSRAIQDALDRSMEPCDPVSPTLEEVGRAIRSGRYPLTLIYDIEAAAMAAPQGERAEFVANMLDSITRQGAETDDPEGERYAVVSDTLLSLMAAILRGE